MTTTINHSETLRLLTLTAGQLVVTKNAGTPAGDPVKVRIQDLVGANLATDVYVKNGATLGISGGLSVSVATQFHVQDNSTLALSGAATISALDTIHMQDDHAILRLGGLALNLPADIAGFTGTDSIFLNGVDGTKAVWTQDTAARGTLRVENDANQVVSTLTLDGHYNPARFIVTDSVGLTRIHLAPAGTTAAISSDTVASNATPAFLASDASSGTPAASDLIAAAQPTAADQGAGTSAGASSSTDTNDAGVGAYATVFDTTGSGSSFGGVLAHLATTQN